MANTLLTDFQPTDVSDTSSNLSPFTDGEWSTAPSSPSWASHDDKPSAQPSEFPSHFPTLAASTQPSVVSAQDTQTPDNWIKRDDRLVRLTGKHPFNCEAKLGDLFAAVSRAALQMYA